MQQKNNPIENYSNLCYITIPNQWCINPWRLCCSRLTVKASKELMVHCVYKHNSHPNKHRYYVYEGFGVNAGQWTHIHMLIFLALTYLNYPPHTHTDSETNLSQSKVHFLIHYLCIQILFTRGASPTNTFETYISIFSRAYTYMWGAKL